MPSFQVHGALSGGVGDLCQQELKASADSREATAFMSKQRSGLRMSALQTCKEKQQPFFMNKKVNITGPLKVLEVLKLFWDFWKVYSMPV